MKFPAFARQFGPSERSLRAWGSGEKAIGRGIFQRVPQRNIWDQSIRLLCTHFLFRPTIVGAINANPPQGVVLLDEKK